MNAPKATPFVPLLRTGAAKAFTPIAVNEHSCRYGLGLSIAEAAAELARLKSLFVFLSDSAAIYAEWERLVTGAQVSGKSGHDARLVAAMTVHGLTHLLTFNVSHFNRFSGITILDAAVLGAPPP
jgi:hypothetical protein